MGFTVHSKRDHSTVLHKAGEAKPRAPTSPEGAARCAVCPRSAFPPRRGALPAGPCSHTITRTTFPTRSTGGTPPRPLRAPRTPALPSAPPAAERRPSPPRVPRWPPRWSQPSWQLTALRSPSAPAAAPSTAQNSSSSSRHNPRRAAILPPRSGRRHSARAADQLHLIPERGGAEGAAGPRTGPAAGGARPGPALTAEGGGAGPEMVGVARRQLRLGRREMAEPPRAAGLWAVRGERLPGIPALPPLTLLPSPSPAVGAARGGCAVNGPRLPRAAEQRGCSGHRPCELCWSGAGLLWVTPAGPRRVQWERVAPAAS